MASLLEMQRVFADALKAGASASSTVRMTLRPTANLDIYRNNSDWQFRHALALSFPVLRRRVGDDYFRQLAFFYREQYPSRSGDLHWVGRGFAEFLAGHLADGEYTWLADLARLEWARELASVSEELPALGADCLAHIAAEDLEGLVFTLQPSLKLGSSAYPVVSVWLANQAGTGPPTDQSLGSERYIVHSWHQTVHLIKLDAPLFSFVSALAAGSSLGDAMTTAGLESAGFVDALRFMFDRRIVVELNQRSDS